MWVFQNRSVGAVFVSAVVLWSEWKFVDGFSTIAKLNQLSSSSSSSSARKALPDFAARDLVRELVQEEKCYSSFEGVQRLLDACESNVVYQDGTTVNPIVGKSNVGSVLNGQYHHRRLDKISDGTNACGFTWTYVTDAEEGLRGTTFVQLNPASGQIQYICELMEPLYKPGDATVELFNVITKDYEPPPETQEKEELVLRTPTKASDIASYMFCEVQGRNLTEVLRFYEEDIVYQDFNYPSAFRGIQAAKEFLEKFTAIQGVTFIPLQFDDGVASSCFLWKVQIMDAPDAILGISFYETNPETGKISFIRDIPESAIKPPPLGTLAKKFRPTLGVFTPKPLGSRPFGIS